VRVGAAARKDAVLSQASLTASDIILGASRKPLAVRQRYVENRLNGLKQGLAGEAARERRRLVARGVNRDQATFDAMRLTIANATMDEGIEQLAEKAARGRVGAESFAGLGELSPNDRAIGCTIAGGGAVAGGVANIVPVYGQIVGAVLGIGSAIAGGAMDCGREQREAQAQAAQAQANLQAAQQQAMFMQQQAAEAQRQRRLKMYLIGGGAVVVLLGVGYYALS
jgi:hypothetical protein